MGIRSEIRAFACRPPPLPATLPPHRAPPGPPPLPYERDGRLGGNRTRSLRPTPSPTGGSGVRCDPWQHSSHVGQAPAIQPAGAREVVSRTDFSAPAVCDSWGPAAECWPNVEPPDGGSLIAQPEQRRAYSALMPPQTGSTLPGSYEQLFHTTTAAQSQHLSQASVSRGKYSLRSSSLPWIAP